MQQKCEQSTKEEKPPWTIQILSNYPLKKKLNKRNQPCDVGTFRFKIKEFGIEVKGVKYWIYKDKVLISMPDANGIINGNKCKFPFLTFSDFEEHKRFMKILKRCFAGFAYGKNFDPYKKEFSLPKGSKTRVFIDLPPRKENHLRGKRIERSPFYR